MRTNAAEIEALKTQHAKREQESAQVRRGCLAVFMID